MEIVRSEQDKWRFMQSLRFFNDNHFSQNILRDILNASKNESLLESNTNRLPESVFELRWPKNWPERDPLVKILCYFLGENHFHLLLKEIREGGISKFMHKLGTGYTNYFNIRHQEIGRLFQGSYKGRTVGEELYLEYLSVYIQVINVMELFPGGLKKALGNIDKGLKFAEKYLFSSYPDYVGLRKSLIIDKDILGERFLTPGDYRKFVREVIEGRKYDLLELEDLRLEG